MKFNKIILLGMMGSGKSTVAKLLSGNLKLNLYDLDEIFEQRENISIVDFFEKYGQQEFRKKETEILKETLSKEKAIISSGGGIILKKENRNLLFNENILTIYLETSAKTIFQRLKNDNTRPLLKVENPLKEIEKIITQREKYYNLAKIKISTENKTAKEIAKEIEQWIK